MTKPTAVMPMVPMDLCTSIPLRSDSETPDIRRLAIALTIALGVHAALITIPVSLAPLAPPVPGTVAGNQSPLQIILLSGKKAEAPPVTNTSQPSTPEKSPKLERRSAEKPKKARAERRPAPSQTDAKARIKPTPKSETLKPETPISETTATEGPRPMDSPADSGAKSRSTVFDPELQKKLNRTRNKVRKFESTDTEYTTATGTFVRHRDRCWEVRESAPGDMSSEASLWFRIKCPKTSRSQSDVDRLADKYGIP